MARSRICVAGTGQVGEALVREASARGYDVLALEVDVQKAQALSRLKGVQVVRLLEGSLHELKESGASECGLVLATADEDEQNLRTITYAIELGVERVVGLASDEEHREIFLKLGATPVLIPARMVAERLLAALISTALLFDVVLPDGTRLAQIAIRERSALLKASVSGRGIAENLFRVIDVIRDGRHCDAQEAGSLRPGDTVTILIEDQTRAAGILESLLR